MFGLLDSIIPVNFHNIRILFVYLLSMFCQDEYNTGCGEVMISLARIGCGLVASGSVILLNPCMFGQSGYENITTWH